MKAVSKATRFEKIVTMIEESEKLKSNLESHAEHLADQLVPYTLAGTILTWLLTRDVTKALAVLMVDFSCALKLAIPISVLSAIREAGAHNITVKGGKYMELLQMPQRSCSIRRGHSQRRDRRYERWFLSVSRVRMSC